MKTDGIGIIYKSIIPGGTPINYDLNGRFNTNISIPRLDKYTQYEVYKYYDIPTIYTEKTNGTVHPLYSVMHKCSVDSVIIKPVLGANSFGIYRLSYKDALVLDSQLNKRDLSVLNIRKDSLFQHTFSDGLRAEEKDGGYDFQDIFNMGICQPYMEINKEYRLMIMNTIPEPVYWISERNDNSVHEKITLKYPDKHIVQIMEKLTKFMSEYRIPILSVDIGLTEDGHVVIETSVEFGLAKHIGGSTTLHKEMYNSIRASIMDQIAIRGN